MILKLFVDIHNIPTVIILLSTFCFYIEYTMTSKYEFRIIIQMNMTNYAELVYFKFK